MRELARNDYAEIGTPVINIRADMPRVIVAENTEFQTIEIIDSQKFGRCLVLDKIIQSSQKDEYIYHELLVHPAMISLPNPQKVLIFGGGEGATLREVLRYQCVVSVDMIELDERVITIAKQYLQNWHQGAFDNIRARVMVGEAKEYLSQSLQKYDLIICDITDHDELKSTPGFHTCEFYEMVKNHLAPGGLIVAQSGSSNWLDGEVMASIYKTLKTIFPIVHGFEVMIPSFETSWGFCVAGMQTDPKKCDGIMVNRRLEERGVGSLRAYDAETHIGLFNPSMTLRTMLATQGRVIHER